MENNNMVNSSPGNSQPDSKKVIFISVITSLLTAFVAVFLLVWLPATTSLPTSVEVATDTAPAVGVEPTDSTAAVSAPADQPEEVKADDVVMVKEPEVAVKVMPKDKTLDWQVYNHADFSFRYPDGYAVTALKATNEGATISLVVYLNQPGATPPPSMQINVNNKQSVSFALWEGMAWEHYDDVRQSFEFK